MSVWIRSAIRENLVLDLSTGDKLESEKPLLSIGCIPDLSVPGVMDIKTEIESILVDEYQKTRIDGIYAAGDITGQKMLAHAVLICRRKK